MIQKHRKLALGILVLLLGVAGGWFGFCHYILKSFKSQLVTLETSLRQQGFEIAYESLECSQHIASLQISVVQPRLKSPKGMGFQSTNLVMTLHPWNWRKIMFSFPHTQDMTLSYGPFTKEIAIKNMGGFCSLTRQQNLEEFSACAERVALLSDGKAHPVALKNFVLNLKSFSTPLDLSLLLKCQLEGVEELFHLPVSAKPITFTFDATLGGLQAQKDLPHSLEAWRDGGGVLDIRALQFSWIPFQIKGEGTLTVDEDMYPLGSFTTRITGYEEGLNYLIAGGVIQRKNAIMVKFVLDMLSRRDEKGKQEIQVPITLQNRKISVGSIPLIKI